MKIYSHFKNRVTLLIVFILLVSHSSCKTTRIISSSNLPIPDSSRYSYIVHRKNFKFLLGNSSISGGILTGKIKEMYKDDSWDSGRKIHLYTTSDSVIKIDTGRIVSVPINEINKVEYRQYSSVKTIILLGGLLIYSTLTIMVAMMIPKPFF